MTKAILGLPMSIELLSVEGLAASLRRSASVLCPTTMRGLVRTTAEVLEGLDGFDEAGTSEVLEEVLDSLVAYGDLVELEVDESGSRSRKLFLGPPAYIPRSDTSACLIVGIRPDGAPIVGSSAAQSLKHVGHTRWVIGAGSESARDLLMGEDLIAMRMEHWLKYPREVSSGALLNQYLERLAAAGSSGDIDAMVLDPEAKVTYYRGRWRSLRSRDSGKYVARRPQAYGADAWCFAEVADGEVTKLIDLPLSPLARAADEAWRLQAAIDAERERPQVVEIRSGSGQDVCQLAFFSPVPSYIQRRLDVIAVPVPHTRGALFCYELPIGEVREELDHLRKMMWTEATLAEGVGFELI